MTIEFTRLFKGESAVFQIGDYGFFKLAKQTGSGGGGGDISFSRIFSENSPETISAVSAEITANNMTSTQVAEAYGWNIGDTIPIVLSTGENIEMRIIGFNHDDKSDGSGKAGITLEMVDCLATTYAMQVSNTNAGGYRGSIVRNQTLPTVKVLLPQEWQDVIKFVDKKSANGGGPNYSAIATSSEDLFLLSGKEVFGTGNGCQNGDDEGEWYEYYEINANSTVDYLIKKRGETASAWWLRSSSAGSVNYFRAVRTTGVQYNRNASSASGVSFAFCV